MPTQSTSPELREAVAGEAKVDVLLSTYNGERFLDAQLRSILAQSWRNLRLVVRDDGSRDGTLAILERYRTDPRVVIRSGANLGVVGSFFALLDEVDADAVAFADQDDVWLPHKLARSMAALQSIPPDVPALYCARLTITNGELEPVGATPLWPRAPSFRNALVENIATGCTVALNRAAADLVRSGGRPAHSVMHDWWCYLVVSAFGTVIYDPEPSVLYRQHGANIVGATASRFARLRAKLRRQMTQDSMGMLLAQAREFRQRFGTPPRAEDAAALAALIDRRGALGRLERALGGRVYRQDRFDDWLLRLRLLLGSWPDGMI